MRRQRRKQQWWTTPLSWILGVGMVFAAIPIASYTHDQLNMWAAPLAWIALAIGLLATVAYFWSKLPGWLVAAIVGFMLGYSFGLALLEGWDVQIQLGLDIARVGLGIGCVVFVIAVFIWTRRVNRHITGVLREVGAEIRTDVLFRDDGERIVVQIDRSRLLKLILQQVVIILLFGAGYHLAQAFSAPSLVLWGVGALIGLGALMTILNVARLMMRRPALVIGPDGLLDNASQIVTGRGLLRWDELLTVFEHTYKPGKLNPTQRMLGIVLTDAAAVRQRQPIFKRALGFLGQGQIPGMLVVTRALLDRPADALAIEIKQYAKRHAPRGWDSPLISDDADATDERAEA